MKNLTKPSNLVHRSATDREDRSIPTATYGAARRSDYTVRLHHCDYFVVRGIRKFVENRLTDMLLPGMKVLDIGCGEQPFRTAVEQRGAVYMGLDIRAHGNPPDAIASSSHLPVRDGTVDLVLCTELLEHVPQPRKVLAELARIVSPDGAILLTVPVAYPLHEEPADFARLTPHWVNAAAVKTGLCVSLMQTSGNELEVAATAWSHIWDHLQQRRGNIAVKLLLAMLIWPANALCRVAEVLLAPILPRRFVLNCLCVLKRLPGK